jgi:hypothetical protein
MKQGGRRVCPVRALRPGAGGCVEHLGGRGFQHGKNRTTKNKMNKTLDRIKNHLSQLAPFVALGFFFGWPVIPFVWCLLRHAK